MSADPLGIIGGSAFLESAELAHARREEVATTRGSVTVHVGEDFVFLRRHGEGAYRPPHRVTHHAHALALAALGVRTAIGFASTGALHERLRPGDVVIPDDYMSWHPPPTFAEDEYLHIVPALDPRLRDLLRRAARASAAQAGARVHEAGVYVETRGPRFETAAEIRMLTAHAHVVGMTAASEATLLQERGIAYAMICIIDNWANGVGTAPLTTASFQQQLAGNTALAHALLRDIVALRRADATAPSPHEVNG